MDGMPTFSNSYDENNPGAVAISGVATDAIVLPLIPRFDPKAGDRIGGAGADIIDGRLVYTVEVDGEVLTARSHRKIEHHVDYTASCWHDAKGAHVRLRRRRSKHPLIGNRVNVFTENGSMWAEFMLPGHLQYPKSLFALRRRKAAA